MAWAAANSNLALVKYWGKEAGPESEIRAAAGSISVTLGGLTTVASVSFGGRLPTDRILWSGPAAPVRRFLDAARRRLDVDVPAEVEVTSNFPVAAGLASSASTFAALALATTAAAGRRLGPDELAALAREGSGSACRSILGGWVEWSPDGRVTAVAPAAHWPLAVVVAVVAEQPKRVGSREGMARTRDTSPYYRAWLQAAAADLAPVRDAIRTRDLAALGERIERNCLRMHAAALAADPPLLYWEPATIAVMRAVEDLRGQGVPAWFSIDAGPQVKVLCEDGDAGRVESALRFVPGVRRTIRSGPGEEAHLLESPPAWAAPERAGREAPTS